MSSTVDAGPILEQRRFPVAERETALSLNTRCFQAGIESFRDLVERIELGTLEPRIQDPAAEQRVSRRTDLPGIAGVIDWTRSASEVAALVRALDFGRYANPLTTPKLLAGEKAFAVDTVEAVLSTEFAAPGLVREVHDDAIVVAATDGDVVIRVLRGLDGSPLSPGEAARTAGMRTGDLLAVDPASARRIGEEGRAAMRGESELVSLLATPQHLDLPYVRRSSAAGAPQFRTESQTIAHSGLDAGQVASALVAYLSRLAGQPGFDIAVADERSLTAHVLAPALFSPYRPVRFDLDFDQAGDLAVETIGAALTARRGACTFTRDVYLRYPQLTGASQDVRPAVLLQLDAAAPPSSLAGGAELALQIESAGRSIWWRFDESVFDPADVATMQRQFATFLASIIAGDTRLSLGEAPLLAPEDRRRVIEEWNDTRLDYRRDLCVHELFEQQAARTPHAVALTCRDEQLTYSQLNTRANQLAAELRSLGVGPDDLVGVFTERSLDMVVAVMGVLKSGGAYVPLDPAYPAERIGFMIEDSRARVILTQERLASRLPASTATVVLLDAGWPAIAGNPAENVPSTAGPEHLAYVIYTSGSTGTPKGVMVEHRNVVNFFAGMDERIDHEEPGSWLAVTSLSFDISVLEIFWTLARGFHVVLYAGDDGPEALPRETPQTESTRPPAFSLFYFASAASADPAHKYRLLLEGARFADAHGFTAVWTPERHFGDFGGLYPNPSVTGAALAAITRQVQIRAGSVVLPLHSPARVAEEWSVVDNLSGGRAGVAFAAGWMPNDFVLAPGGYGDNKERMFADIEVVRRLWRGDAVDLQGPDGATVSVRTLPRPLQGELPVWVTTAGNIETYRRAAEIGANVLTHLLGQSVEELGEKVRVYREAWRAAGHPGEGQVALMLHTFVGTSDAAVRELVREPMKRYLASSVSLIRGFAASFPTFRAAGVEGTEFDALPPEDLDALLEFAFSRYFESSGLFGSPATCVAMVERLERIGVDEIACLVDFGVEESLVLRQLEDLSALKDMVTSPEARAPASSQDYSIGALARRHGVTHLQCTPSMATLLAADNATRTALASLRTWLIGGEAFPPGLAAEIGGFTSAQILNMYGPTETTIWSATEPVHGAPASVPIGRPIANTQLYILDERLQPVPPGASGELFIGGEGVVRGYWNRPGLTAERFVPDHLRAAPGRRLYRTGDLARYLPDGRVEFLGRLDYQVKIRGHRIELGEIEARINAQPGIRECVVIAREDTPGDRRLVAYAVPAGSSPLDVPALRECLAESLPEFMVPAHIVVLDQLPKTPNQKVNRKALPPPAIAQTRSAASSPPPASGEERLIARVWEEVLGVPGVGRSDNFFDLGGDSLLIVRVHRRLKAELGREIPLTDLFRFPTVRALAAHLSPGSGSAEPASRKGTERAALRLAAAGRRRGESEHSGQRSGR